MHSSACLPRPIIAKQEDEENEEDEEDEEEEVSTFSPILWDSSIDRAREVDVSLESDVTSIGKYQEWTNVY
ncbi:hypothetical protein HZH68_008108 [Vespula germanica]|uniref:Uncharacterized protein n=1 Tax=Vespula germanica TaxID=30212 RepID=A0A834K3T9_VESGE|nr:hypothetical protein HZH68_008108 [Vespula germanica]